MTGAAALHVAATAAALYVTAFVAVRIAGRRTVSQLSAFDALITITLGSILAGAMVSDPPSYGRGAIAVGTLLVLQLALGALRQRVPRLRRILDFAPDTVYDERGEHLDGSPFGAQLTSDELDGAVRTQGLTSRDTVSTIVLEPSGSMSVLRDTHRRDQ